MTLTDEQKEGISLANEALKKVFPKDNLRICFNIARTHSDVNFNIKISGILSKKT